MQAIRKETAKLWKDIHTAIVQKRTGLAGEELAWEVESKYPFPYSLDFRIHE